MTSFIASGHLKLESKKVFPKQKLSMMFEEPFPRKNSVQGWTRLGYSMGFF